MFRQDIRNWGYFLPATNELKAAESCAKLEIGLIVFVVLPTFSFKAVFKMVPFNTVTS